MVMKCGEIGTIELEIERVQYEKLGSEGRGLIMIQPGRDEITSQLKKVIRNEITREEVGAWAYDFISNDDTVEINDIEVWHYLVSISVIDIMIAPNKYLYSIEDIESWIEENNE